MHVFYWNNLIDKYLLYLSCRWYIIELVLKSVFKVNLKVIESGLDTINKQILMCSKDINTLPNK